MHVDQDIGIAAHTRGDFGGTAAQCRQLWLGLIFATRHTLNRRRLRRNQSTDGAH